LRRAKTAFATIFVACLAATYLLAAVRLDQAAAVPAAPGSVATTGWSLPFVGQASYYGAELAGRATASGEVFDPGLLTAAHRTLPLGSEVQVTNLDTGLSTVVRINDRGPFTGAVIDLSTAAAQQIGMLPTGSARVALARIR